MTTNTTTHPNYYANHTTEQLHNIVARFDAMARAMIGTDLGLEALGIAAAAEAQLILRGESK